MQLHLTNLLTIVAGVILLLSNLIIMKESKTVLIWIVIFLLTWVLIGLIIYLLSDDTFKQACKEPGLFFCLVVFGWVPATVVAIEYNESY